MKILHLDRSAFFQKIIKRGAAGSSAEIFSCTSMDEAMGVLGSEVIDLIITGQELQDGTAEEFLKLYSESGLKQLPVIMLSSTDSIEMREKYFNKGVIDFISKNEFDNEKLNELINNFFYRDELTESLKKASIAIVDDSSFSINVLKKILRLHGIDNFETYSDPSLLIESQKEFDIYLIDMVMPKISGNQLIIKLRKKHPMSVVIVISSLDNYNTILNALESGADDHIMKPFDARFLIGRLKTNYRNFLLMKELDERRKKMEEMAVTDELTGAKNRRFLFNQMNREVGHARRQGGPLSVMLLDVDFFKRINDTWGHSSGDTVLQKLSSVITENCRDFDIFGRYGGEEFMLIMPDTELEQALVSAERLRKLFSECRYPGISEDLRVSFSGGVCQWNGETVEDFVKKADKLLYAAKNDGRDNIKH